MRNIIDIIFEISIYSSIMILLVLVAKALFKKKVSSKIMSFLWIMILMRLLFPITIDSPIHMDKMIPDRAESEIASLQPQTTEDTEKTGKYIQTKPDVTLSNTVNAANEQPEVKKVTSSFFEQATGYMESISIWMYVCIIWALGAIVLFFKKIIGYSRFKSRVKNCKRMDDLLLIKAFRNSKRQLGINKHVSLLSCKYINIPITFGVINPVILLPHSFQDKIDNQKLRMIVMHELCHIKRLDVLKNYLWLIATTIYWFNPLVWIAYKNYASTIELICDELVLKNVSNEESYVYSESLLDVMKLSNRISGVSVALSFCESKTKLRERVENMMEPKRKSKPVGIMAIGLALIMLIGCFTTACQPTPDKEIVQGKNNDTLEEKISEGQADDAITGQRDNTNERAEMIVTDTWQDDSIESKPYLSISADAQVLMPDIDQYMAYEIDPSAKLTNDMVRKLIGALAGDAELHDGEEVSKAEVEARIVDVRKELHDMENDVNKDAFSGRDEEGRDYTEYKNDEIKRLNAEIEALNKLMESATDGYETTIDINTVDFENTDTFEAKAFVGKSTVASIALLDSLFFHFSNPGNFSTSNIDESEKIINLTINDATAIGNNLLSEAGLDMYDIKSVGLGYQYIGDEGASQANNPQGYVIYYERIVNGMPVSSVIRLNEEESGDYVQHYEDEELKLAIDDAGIAELDLVGYYALDEDSASIVDVVPMDEDMKGLIIQQMYNCYSPYYEQDKKKVKYIIDKVELVMGRVPMKDNPERQWLIPVWNVYATSHADTGEGYVPSDRGSSLVLSVNALDGSVN